LPPEPAKFLLCAYGIFDEASQLIGRLRAITPLVMEPATRYRNPELRELFLSGLRLGWKSSHKPIRASANDPGAHLAGQANLSGIAGTGIGVGSCTPLTIF
jgi:hypothetical protein